MTNPRHSDEKDAGADPDRRVGMILLGVICLGFLLGIATLVLGIYLDWS